jgi:hypothetical protein
MATLPTKEENGRKILDIYSHFRSRPGHVLLVNNFIAVGARRRWEMSDVQQGLDFAIEKGWIRPKNHGFELTESGFEAMWPAMSDQQARPEADDVRTESSDFTDEHLRWLVQSRSKNQEITLQLYLAIKNNRISIEGDVRYAYLAQELAAVAFSLWRSVFLSDLTETVEKQMADVERFLSTLISNNAIAYQQDRNSREWTFYYYLKNASDRLLTIARQGPLELLDVSDIEIAASSAKEDWTIAQDALAKAIGRFSQLTKPK